MLLVFPATRRLLTAAGQAERDRLTRAIEQARTIPRMLDENPKQAAAIAAALGGLLLLAPEVLPHLGALAAALKLYPADDLAQGFDSFSDGGFDLSGFDGAAFDGFSDSLAAMDTQFDAAVSSSDSGGSDSSDSSSGED
jgi:hypothetical protein